MSPPHFFITIALIIGTIIAVFAMKYGAAAAAARARIASERQHDDRLSVIESEVARLSAALGRVERILKDVE